MKNKEKYAKELVDLMLKGLDIAIDKKTGVPCSCEDISCCECLLNLSCCGNKGLQKWAEKEYNDSILDESEQQYLSAVIKPFKDAVTTIYKSFISTCNLEYLTIDTIKGTFSLPAFETGEMYKGMECNKLYTLTELEL